MKSDPPADEVGVADAPPLPLAAWVPCAAFAAGSAGTAGAGATAAGSSDPEPLPPPILVSNRTPTPIASTPIRAA